MFGRIARPPALLWAAPEQPDAAEAVRAFTAVLRRAGHRVVRGTGMQPLDHPLLASAPLVLLAPGDDAAAPGLAAAAVAARNGAAGEILVIAEDLASQIALRDVDTAAGDAIRVRPLGRAAFEARRLLTAVPPDRLLRGTGGVHLAVAGLAPDLAGHLLAEAARRLHAPGLRPYVTLHGAGMPALLARLRAILPELDAVGDFAAAEAIAAGTALPTAIFAAAVSLGAALDPTGLADVTVPVLPDWRVAAARLLDDPADATAKAIHALFLEERRHAGDTLGIRPSVVPWTMLPERYRAASRHQADHMAFKLRTVGARAVPAKASLPPFAWTAGELAALAETEHERWMAVLRVEGWRHGAARDDTAKRSPYLCDFAALTQDIRDLDRLPVRAVPSQYALAGFAAVRDLIVAAEADPDAVPGPAFPAGLAALFARLGRRHPDRQLTLRIDPSTPLGRAAASAAQAAHIPLQLALSDGAAPDMAGALARHAARVAIGDATRYLPPPTLTLRLGRGGGDLQLDAAGKSGSAIPDPGEGRGRAGLPLARLVQGVGIALWLFAQAAIGLGRMLFRPDRFDRRRMVDALVETTLLPLPMATALAALTGLVLGFSAGEGLALIRLESVMLTTLRRSLTRDAVPLIVGLFVFGRFGVALAVRLAQMRVNGEADTLRGLGIEPARWALAPALLGFMVAGGALTVWGVAVAHLAAALVLQFGHDLPARQYATFMASLDLRADVIAGLMRAEAFALFTMLAAGLAGTTAEPGPDGAVNAARAAFLTALLGSVAITAVFSGLGR